MEEDVAQDRTCADARYQIMLLHQRQEPVFKQAAAGTHRRDVCPGARYWSTSSVLTQT